MWCVLLTPVGESKLFHKSRSIPISLSSHLRDFRLFNGAVAAEFHQVCRISEFLGEAMVGKKSHEEWGGGGKRGVVVEVSVQQTTD